MWVSSWQEPYYLGSTLGPLIFGNSCIMEELNPNRSRYNGLLRQPLTPQAKLPATPGTLQDIISRCLSRPCGPWSKLYKELYRDYMGVLVKGLLSCIQGVLTHGSCRLRPVSSKIDGSQAHRIPIRPLNRFVHGFVKGPANWQPPKCSN